MQRLGRAWIVFFCLSYLGAAACMAAIDTSKTKKPKIIQPSTQQYKVNNAFQNKRFKTKVISQEEAQIITETRSPSETLAPANDKRVTTEKAPIASEPKSVDVKTAQSQEQKKFDKKAKEFEQIEPRSVSIQESDPNLSTKKKADPKEINKFVDPRRSNGRGPKVRKAGES